MPPKKSPTKSPPEGAPWKEHDDLEDMFPVERAPAGRPTGRNPTLPSMLQGRPPTPEGEAGGFEMLEEFNPILELLSPGVEEDDVQTRTELRDLEILQISRALHLSTLPGCDGLRNWTTVIMRLKISRKRGSRQEVVEAMRAMGGLQDTQQARGVQSLLSKLRGG